MAENIFDLTNKTILITGASSGIGKAAAIQCSRIGARTCITGRNEERLFETLDEIQTVSDKSASVFIFDFIETKKIDSFVNGLPVLDGAVLNAGISKVIPVKLIDQTDVVDIFHINTISQILLFKELVRQRKLQKNASVVFISSMAGLGENAIGTSLYAASKSAICGFIKGAALEVADKGIRVNTVCPGKVNTGLLKKLEILNSSGKEGVKQYPLGRYGEPDDIANAIVFFLSDASSWVTGIDFVIDGGLHLKR